jgi:hypothetical protein
MTPLLAAVAAGRLGLLLPRLLPQVQLLMASRQQQQRQVSLLLLLLVVVQGQQGAVSDQVLLLLLPLHAVLCCRHPHACLWSQLWALLPPLPLLLPWQTQHVAMLSVAHPRTEYHLTPPVLLLLLLLLTLTR